jgi:lysine-N-methylase
MTLPIRVLPIAERWECHHCGDCCKGTIVTLGDEDLRKFRGQRWEEHPDYRGTKVLVRSSLFGGRYRLAHGPDGYCVFRTADSRCRIHQEFGFAAKPRACRLAPLDLVPLERFACLTLHRYCPSAAAGRGPAIERQIQAAKELTATNDLPAQTPAPPPISPRQRLPWRGTLAVAKALERLVVDGRFPLPRRIVHGLKFCDLASQCRLARLESDRLGELLNMLTAAVVEESGDMLREQIAPRRQAGLLFRQTALECMRLHPQFVVEDTWAERWRMIVAAVAFGRGRGPVPRFRLPFPATTFEHLERPSGPPSEAVIRPLDEFVQTAVASMRFAALGRPGWSIVESFRSLALSTAVAFWLIRLACPDRAPEFEDAVRAVVTIDRGLQYSPLLGPRHRFRIRGLAADLPRLVLWYAR